MLYDEFIEGTGCRDNEHNYKLYKELELIYMNTDCSKAHIYEMGKKLMDNSKSENELQVEAEVKAEIEQIKATIEFNKSQIAYYKTMKRLFEEDGDKDMAQGEGRMVKYYTEENKKLRNRIKALEWVLAA